MSPPDDTQPDEIEEPVHTHRRFTNPFYMPPERAAIDEDDESPRSLHRRFTRFN